LADALSIDYNFAFMVSDIMSQLRLLFESVPRSHACDTGICGKEKPLAVQFIIERSRFIVKTIMCPWTLLYCVY
jgi:hypothetical protein